MEGGQKTSRLAQRPPLLTETHRYDHSGRKTAMKPTPASPCQRGGRGRRSRMLRRFAAELRSASARRAEPAPRARSRAPGNTKARSQPRSGLSCLGDGWRIARPFTSACSPSTAPPSSPAPRPAAASSKKRAFRGPIRSEVITPGGSRPGKTRRRLVSDHTAGKVGEDRCESGEPRAVRHVPIGRGGGAERLVPKDPEADR